MLPQVHQVEQPREGTYYWKLNSSTLKNWIDLSCAGCVQAGGQQGRLPVVGDAQEQARHELRDDGQGTQVRDKLFSGRNNKQIACNVALSKY